MASEPNANVSPCCEAESMAAGAVEKSGPQLDGDSPTVSCPMAAGDLWLW